MSRYDRAAQRVTPFTRTLRRGIIYERFFRDLDPPTGRQGERIRPRALDAHAATMFEEERDSCDTRNSFHASGARVAPPTDRLLESSLSDRSSTHAKVKRPEWREFLF